MALTIDDVRKIATLARLRFQPEEEAAMAEQLGRIVEYIDQLQRLPEGPAAPAAAPQEESAARRQASDVPAPCMPREVLLANAPAVEGAFLLVPEVKGGAGDEPS